MQNFDVVILGAGAAGLFCAGVAGQRGLEVLRRCLAEAAASLAMEIHRCRMQAQQDGRRLHRAGALTVVLGGEVLEAELGLAARFPEEFRLDAFRFAFRALEQLGRRRSGEAQQYVGGLHLDALAAAGLDLQRGRVVGEHGAGLEGAVLFKQDIHREMRETGTGPDYTRRPRAISTSLCGTKPSPWRHGASSCATSSPSCASVASGRRDSPAAAPPARSRKACQ